MVWADPRSLAATDGVSFDFLSYGYLDVSVPRVGSGPVNRAGDTAVPGFPIRTSSDHRVLARFPRLIAGSYVLHRLLSPRHPPHALCSLIRLVCALVAEPWPHHRSDGARSIDNASTPSLFKLRKSGPSSRPPERAAPRGACSVAELQTEGDCASCRGRSLGTEQMVRAVDLYLDVRWPRPAVDS